MKFYFILVLNLSNSVLNHCLQGFCKSQQQKALTVATAVVSSEQSSLLSTSS